YYGLKETDNLTEKQINKYLYLEAIGKLESRENSIVNQDKQKVNSDMNKKEKIEDLLKQVERKKVLLNQYIEKEKKLIEEIDELLKKAEVLTEGLKKEKRPRKIIIMNSPTKFTTNYVRQIATLKKYFNNPNLAPARNLVNCQRVIRTDDLANINAQSYHQTLFEMLGDFSIGVKENHILLGSKKTNFWDMGDGPCGSNTEIYYDFCREKELPKNIEELDNKRFIEICNIVFPEFYHKGEEYLPLAEKCVDTGAGLERIAMFTDDTEEVRKLIVEEFQPNKEDHEFAYYLTNKGIKPEQLNFELKEQERRGMKVEKLEKREEEVFAIVNELKQEREEVENKSESERINKFKSYADMDSPEALYRLAIINEYTVTKEEFKKNPEHRRKVTDLLKKARDLGHEVAKRTLQVHFFNFLQSKLKNKEKLEEEEQKKLLENFEKLANEKMPEALLASGKIYVYGWLGIENNKENILKGIDYLNLAKVNSDKEKIKNEAQQIIEELSSQYKEDDDLKEKFARMLLLEKNDEPIYSYREESANDEMLEDKLDSLCKSFAERLVSGDSMSLSEMKREILCLLTEEENLVEQQIEVESDLKFSTNIYQQKAYQLEKPKVEKALKDLESFQNNTTQPTKSGFFRPEVIVPLALVIVLVAAVVTVVVIRRRKQLKLK
ncbi:25084_t:CDS:10, partial [Gigaspora margarita]